MFPSLLSWSLISAPGTLSAPTLIRIFTNVTTLAFIIAAMWGVRSGSELRGSFSEFTQRWPRRDQPGAGQLGGGSGSVIVKYLYQPKSLNLGARHYLGPTCVLHIKYLYMQQGQSRLQKEINLFGVNTATRIRERLSWHQSLTFPRNALTAASLTQLVFCRK